QLQALRIDGARWPFDHNRHAIGDAVTMRKLPAVRRLALAVIVASVCVLAKAGPASAQTPFYAGAHLSAHSLSPLDQGNVGFGVRGGYEAYPPFISLEAEMNFLPWSSKGSFGETQGFFGLRFGKKIGNWGGYIRVRPGFTH